MLSLLSFKNRPQTTRSMLKAVIVDDEILSRQSLERLILDYCPEVEILASVGDILSAVKEINSQQPDLVFLDIELPNYSGFELIKCFDEIFFDIVFTTGYEHYAVKAFKVSAAGYLLKPIDVEELSEVVNRIKNRRQARRELQSDANDRGMVGKPHRAVLPAQDGLIYLNINMRKY